MNKKSEGTIKVSVKEGNRAEDESTPGGGPKKAAGNSLPDPSLPSAKRGLRPTIKTRFAKNKIKDG